MVRDGLSGVVVFERVGVGDDGLSVLVEQRREPARIARGMEIVVDAGFAVDPDFVDVRNALGIDADKAFILTHNVPPLN